MGSGCTLLLVNAVVHDASGVAGSLPRSSVINGSLICETWIQASLADTRPNKQTASMARATSQRRQMRPPLILACRAV